MKQEIKIKTKSLLAMLGAFGAICSISSILISQAISQSSSGNNSPNISGKGDVSVHISSAPKGNDWIEERDKNRPDISEKQFKRLVPGLTYEEVVNIEGVLQSKSDSGASYAWGKSPFYYMHAFFDRSGELMYAVNNGLF